MNRLVRSYGDTDFITGLRAIAALMVIGIHTAALRDFGWLGDIITDNGKYGVQIFFVISGFTIARTYRNATGFAPYFGRRMMRIAPLYFVVIIFAFWLIYSGYWEKRYWMTLYASEADAYNLLMHLSFLSAWDPRVANSLLGVEWSIPIEVFWYAVLPLVLPIATQMRTRMGIFLGLLVLAGLTKAAEYLFLPPHAAHFMPLSYGAYFYLGAVAENMRPQVAGWSVAHQRRLFYGSAALFGLTLCLDTGFNAALFGLATAGLIVGHHSAAGRRGILVSLPLLFLGSISYSLYLLHPLITSPLRRMAAIEDTHSLLFFGLVVAATTLASTFTYLVIERPTNRIGARFFGLTNGHRAA